MIDLGVVRHGKDPLRLVRREVRALLGQDVSVPVRLRCPRVRLGSDYGGWWIRSDVLGPASTVYSVGIGRDVTFDMGLIHRYGLTVHAFDPTRHSRDWVHQQQLPANFVFTQVGLAPYDGSGSFVLRSRPDWDNYELNVSGDGAFDSEELPVARLRTLMKRFGHDHVDLLKLDIEGAEYDVLQEMLSSDLDVRQILIEFHYERGRHGHLSRLKGALEDLRLARYVLFARSPTGSEFSFWRPIHA